MNPNLKKEFQSGKTKPPADFGEAEIHPGLNSLQLYLKMDLVHPRAAATATPKVSADQASLAHLGLLERKLGICFRLLSGLWFFVN